MNKSLLIFSFSLLPYGASAQSIYRYLGNAVTQQAWTNPQAWRLNIPNNFDPYPRNGASVEMREGFLALVELDGTDINPNGPLNFSLTQFIATNQSPIRLEMASATVSISELLQFNSMEIRNDRGAFFQDGGLSLNNLKFVGNFFIDDYDVQFQDANTVFGNPFGQIQLSSGARLRNNGNFNFIPSFGAQQAIILNDNNRSQFVNNGIITVDGLGVAKMTAAFTQRAGQTLNTDGVLVENMIDVKSGEISVNREAVIEGGLLRSESVLSFRGDTLFIEEANVETVGDGYLNFENSINFGLRLISNGEADKNSHVRLRGIFEVSEFALSKEAPLVLLDGRPRSSGGEIFNTGYMVWDGGRLGNFTNTGQERGQFVIRSFAFGITDPPGIQSVNPTIQGNRTFNNNGYFLQENDILTLEPGASIVNNLGATYEIQNFGVRVLVNDAQSLQNSGTLLKTDMDGASVNALIQCPIESTGSLEVLSSDLSLNAGGILNQAVKVEGPQSSLTLLSSAVLETVLKDLTITANAGGIVQALGGPIQVEGLVQATGSEGLIHINSTGVVVTTDDILSGTLSGSEQVPVKFGDLLNSPIISPEAPLINAGEMEIDQARLIQNTFLNTGNLLISRNFNLSPILNEIPHFENSGIVTQNGNIQLGNFSKITILENGLYTINQGSLMDFGAEQSFTIEEGGTLKVESTQSVAHQIQVDDIILNGEVEVATGNLEILSTRSLTVNGGKIDVGSGAAVTLNREIEGLGLSALMVNGNFSAVGNIPLPETGRLSGSGTINGTIMQGGLLAPGNPQTPAATLTLQGDLTQQGTARTEIDLLATTQDRVNVSGAVTLAGALILNIENEAMFPQGTEVSFLTAGSLNGAFTQVSSNIPGSIWSVSYSATEATLRREENDNSYDAWATSNFGAGADDSVTGFSADPDGDGVENGFEYLQGTSPQESSVLEYEFELVPDDADASLSRVRVSVPFVGNPEGLVLSLLQLNELGVAQDDVILPTVLTTEGATGDHSATMNLLSDAFTLDDRSFYRLRLSQQ